MKYIFALLYGTLAWCAYGNNVVSYELSSGRLGDHILAFAKALYISHVYKIPLIYVPFEHSQYLALDNHPSFFSKKTKLYTYDKVVRVTTETNFDLQDTITCFVTNLGSQHGAIKSLDSIYTYAAQDKEFDMLLKKMLTPNISITKLNLPTNIITVALHVRKGSGTDQPLLHANLTSKQRRLQRYIPKIFSFYADQHWPHKFPPDEYYINQLILLSELLNNQPLYVYLFTDDKNPALLIEKYTAAINKPNIRFDYQTTESPELPLNDFWNMAQFDCLIRAASNFSRSSQLLGNHKIVLSIKKALWVDNTIITPTINIAIRNQKDGIFINKSIPAKLENQNIKLFNRMKKLATECFCNNTTIAIY